ncbi:MAG TPA: hypothetical protein VGJ33_19800 [Candidatus Angelobacter sp.]
MEDAEANLSIIGPDAEQYTDARFYLGITKAQLRKADESIEILENLLKGILSDKKRGDFADRISLQLAYAHTKKYTDKEFAVAEKILDRLTSNEYPVDLILQAKSLQAFLYSVMAGYSKLEEKKSEFIRKAFKIGEEIVKNPRSTPAVRFEALNALGIAWMRFADKSQQQSAIGEAAGAWEKAEYYFKEALSIIPNSVRVLQNLGTLRLLQLNKGIANDPSMLLREAKQFVQRSLEVNDQDQFPFYQLAQIAVAEKDRANAFKYIREGRSRPGAVQEKSWTKVESAAQSLPT